MPPKVFSKKITSAIRNRELVEKRRDQLFESARRLFSQKGYHLTGLRELSKESAIGLGNLYNYINTKEDILSIIHQKTAKIVLAELSQGTKSIRDPRKKLREMIEIELRTMDKYQDLILLLYQESHILSKGSLNAMLKNEEIHMKKFKKVIEDGIAAGLFRPVNVDVSAHIIKMVIDCWVLKRWAFPKIGIEEMKREILQIVEKGILNTEMPLKPVEIKQV